MTLELNKIYCWDCLELMKEIDDNSIDMILCDLPYWTTACSWDIVIPFEPLREQYKRIIKENWAIVLFGSQPFTTDLINSNRKWFKYELIYDKWRASGFATANKIPMKIHENICVFYNNHWTYNPIKIKGKKNIWRASQKSNSQPKNMTAIPKEYNDRFPTTILRFNKPWWTVVMHPTQKSVDLCKYLIDTYTNKGELVMDNCIWSWTTAVACKELGRNFIGIEKEQKYVDIANKRLSNTTTSLF